MAFLLQVFATYMHLKDASVPRRVAKRTHRLEPEQQQSHLTKMTAFVRCVKTIPEAELFEMDLRTIRYSTTFHSTSAHAAVTHLVVICFTVHMVPYLFCTYVMP